MSKRNYDGWCWMIGDRALSGFFWSKRDAQRFELKLLAMSLTYRESRVAELCKVRIVRVDQ